MKIVWTDPAVEDLELVKEFISRGSEFYALRFVTNIFDAVENLVHFPTRGRRVPEADDDTIREIIYFPYRIMYRIKPDRIVILTIIHGARDVGAVSPKPWDLIS